MLSSIRDSFLKFERANEHEKRIKHFHEALEKISKYLATNPSDEETGIVENIKLSYVRKLLEQIGPESGFTYPDEEWIQYLLIISKCKKEVDQLTAKNKILLENYNIFKESTNEERKELLRLLEAGYFDK